MTQRAARIAARNRFARRKDAANTSHDSIDTPAARTRPGVNTRH